MKKKDIRIKDRAMTLSNKASKPLRKGYDEDRCFIPFSKKGGNRYEW